MRARALILGGAALLFLFVVLSRLGQAEELGTTLRRGHLGWITVALVLQAATLWNQVALYQTLYALLKLPARWRELAPLVWTGHFLNAATPSAGLGGTALLIDDARRRGWPLAKVSLANALYFLFNFVVFAFVLAAGLGFLLAWNQLKPSELVAAGTLLGGLMVAGLGLLLLAWRPALFGHWAARFARGLNRLTRRTLLAPDQISEGLAEFSQTLRALQEARGALWRPLLHALLVDGLEIAVLGACCAAFPGAGREVTLPLLIVGYAIGTLFVIVSVTPQGLGVVEGVMTAMFCSLGVPLQRAAVVVLAYRGLSFWLPLLTGFVALRWTPRLQGLPRTRVKTHDSL